MIFARCKSGVAGIVLTAMTFLVGANETFAQESSPYFQLYDDSMERVFKVGLANSLSGELRGHGTAFVLSESGFLATAFHVVSDAALHEDADRSGSKPSVYIIRKGARIEAEIWAVDPRADVAILRVPLRLPRPWPLSSGAPRKGEALFAIGFPGVAEYSIIQGQFQSGKVSHVSPLYQASLSIEAGMSGGPVLNAKNEVIGMSVARSRNFGSEQALLGQSQAIANLLSVASKRKQPSSDESLLEEISQAIWRLQDQRAEILKSTFEKRSEFYSYMISGSGNHPDVICGESERNDREKKPIHYRECFFKLSSGDEHVSFKLLYQVFEPKVNQFKSAYHSGDLLNINNEMRKQPAKYSSLVCEEDLHIHRADQSWVVSICSRSSRRFSDMLHTVVRVASLDFKRPALVARLELAGFSQKNMKELVLRFIDLGKASTIRGGQ